MLLALLFVFVFPVIWLASTVALMLCESLGTVRFWIPSNYKSFRALRPGVWRRWLVFREDDNGHDVLDIPGAERWGYQELVWIWYPDDGPYRRPEGALGIPRETERYKRAKWI